MPLSTGSQEMPELFERISTLPTVQSVGATSTLPISGSWCYLEEGEWSLEGELPKQSGEERRLYWQVCSPDYFQAMGISVLKGRGIEQRDRAGSSLVAIVNEMFVRQLLGGQEPLSKRLRLNLRNSQREYTIVGIVRNVKHLGLDKEEYPEVFFPWGQQPHDRRVDLVIRGRSNVKSLAGSIRAAIREVYKQTPIPRMHTMEEVIQDSLLGRRFQMILVGLFSSVGLMLAAAGIYGTVSYLVEQRTHEIGVRMAMGAEREDVLRLVIGHGMRLTLIGIVIGFAGAFALNRFLSSFLFQTSPNDPVTFGVVSLFVCIVAFVACYVPARRAARIDPMEALRYE
jgi:putative ABC transport system permease protein